MLFTSALLGLLYVGFAVVLFYVLHVGLALMLVIVIGTRLRPVLHLGQARPRGRRARRSSPRSEAPELHAMVERLCAMADLPKPRIAVVPPTSRTRSRPVATRSTPASP